MTRRLRMCPPVRAALLTLWLASCVGSVDAPEPGGPGGDKTGPGSRTPDTSTAGAVLGGMRRLSAREFRNTLFDLVGVDPVEWMYGWPSDSRPYDTSYLGQTPSQPLTESLNKVADMVAAKVVGDPTLRRKVITCTPAGATDPACLRQIITTFGRRALRRPLEADEVAAIETAAARSSTDFNGAVQVLIRALLQDAELVYRLECGGCSQGSGKPPDPDDRAIALGSWEVASRLSYLLWGSMPDETLFGAADRDELRTEDGVRRQALRMLGTAQARKRVNAFHAMWLGYEYAPLQYPVEMKAETEALLARVIFERPSPWLDIFNSKETYVNATLAAHYGNGLARPSGKSSAWVGYGATGRQGILSHGSFLSVASAPGDTSTTKRGLLVRNQLLCEDIPPPPPPAELKRLNGGKDVDVSKPLDPDPGECRLAKVQRAQLGPGCVECHRNMDPIGFGLEPYDMAGKYRTTESGRPSCALDGKGQLAMPEGGALVMKDFSGPAGLGDVLTGGAARAKIVQCLSRQLFQFAAGRRPGQPGDDDVVAGMSDQFEKSGFDFQEMVLAYVTAPAFGSRLVHALGEGR